MMHQIAMVVVAHAKATPRAYIYGAALMVVGAIIIGYDMFKNLDRITLLKLAGLALCVTSLVVEAVTVFS